MRVGRVLNTAEWRTLLTPPEPGNATLVPGRRQLPTLQVNDVYLHSLYDPVTEAKRLIDSAGLDKTRPVLLLGLGLGYVVKQLLEQGYEVLVLEPNPAVAYYALAHGLQSENFLLGLGTPDELKNDAVLRTWCRRRPQLLVHPPTARVEPTWTDAVAALIGTLVSAGQRFRIAVVGPMYGGSLPIAGYLAKAFRQLGHDVREVENRDGWALYQALQCTVERGRLRAPLQELLVRFLAEWTYVRTVEFRPDLCIVLAQAPVQVDFPIHLRNANIITAYWYVENWRHLPYWRDIAPTYDYFFHLQPGDFDTRLRALGVAHTAHLQTACDPEVHRPVSLSPVEEEIYGCDISFAGAGYPNRIEVLKALTDFNLKIWGVEWNVRELWPFVQNDAKPFDAETFCKIVAGSKINLNLHASKYTPGIDPACDAVNPRVFEIAAAGGFQLCDPCQGLSRYFDFSSELPVYRSVAELREKIAYFLAHPEERREYAERARARALREHTYEHRAQEMLHKILEAHGARLMRSDRPVAETASEFLQRAGIPEELQQWLGSLPPETSVTLKSLLPLVKVTQPEATEAEKRIALLGHIFTFAESLLQERGMK